MFALDKLIIHFESRDVGIYRSNGEILSLLDRKRLKFDGAPTPQLLGDSVAGLCESLAELTPVMSNRNTRLYATGIFQRLSKTDETELVNRVYVDTGLRLNIIRPRLEQFYLEQSGTNTEVSHLLEGLVKREFRKVAVCGSFQQSLPYIEEIIARLRARKVDILSPASTRIKPETLGSDFILFDYQDYVKNERDTWRHKYGHMDKFREADAAIVCNPGGLVGKGTLFELGFMAAVSCRVIFTEMPVGLSIFFPHEVA